MRGKKGAHRLSPINQNTAAMKRMDVSIRAVDLQLLILSCIKVQKESLREKTYRTQKHHMQSIELRPEIRSTEM
jgi:hypothetical protein